jgi:hypothetical protein
MFNLELPTVLLKNPNNTNGHFECTGSCINVSNSPSPRDTHMQLKCVFQDINKVNLANNSSVRAALVNDRKRAQLM